MNRSLQITLLALAALVVAFVATWLTMPQRAGSVDYPARLFGRGVTHTTYGRCIRYAGQRTCQQFEVTGRNVIGRRDVSTLERRVKVIFGGAAAVIVLVGVAFGALPRRKSGAAS